MVRKIRKQNKRGVGVSLETVTKGFVKGIGGLLGLAAKLEEEGKDEYAEQGEIKGKTRLRQGFGGQAKSGKEYKGAYGFHVKVGLNPDDFFARGGSARLDSRQARQALGGNGRKKLSIGIKK